MDPNSTAAQQGSPTPSKTKGMTPELKEIYERVMNTPVKSITPLQPPSAASPQIPATPLVSPAASTHPVPEASGVAGVVSPISQMNQPFLSSLPPRPITDGSKPFAFSGKKNPIEHVLTPSQTNAPAAQKQSILKTFVIPGIILFLVGYIVFWLKILKYF